MAASSQATGREKASWDDVNTGIFLGALIDEIDAGNCQGGHFTKAAWNAIRLKFNSKSGCNFSQGLLKNKLDNLKKDYQLWEKLRCEESGLGYDAATNRITADAVWWRQKIQERPEYERFKTHGLVHLDMQEKVFRGIVATGYLVFNPGRDQPFGTQTRPDDNDENVEISVESEGNPGVRDDSDHVPQDVPLPSQPTLTVGGRKRPRRTSSSKEPSLVDVSKGLLQYIDICKANESASSVKGDDDTLSYRDAIKLLKALPWIDSSVRHFGIAAAVLADPVNRVCFVDIVDLGEKFVKSWLDELAKSRQN